MRRVRGRLGSLMMVNANLGILLAFVAGCYLSYIWVARVFIIIPILFFLSLLFFPETPVYFMRTNRELVSMRHFPQKYFSIINMFFSKKAVKSLEFYRNIRSREDRNMVDFVGEMEQLKAVDLNGDTEIQVPLSWHDFSKLP